ncbi:CDP-diacylglycerol--glycerol-3-phosphate 3-phosphatidyltransferase [Syntrophotalea carbinolica DSM 2380]|uniref:CDP-diacylglycerol--glycerol-3-phosphate 3-phosphatidyltransferase n=1 Tax=Syntrophotalea carbinolica (strain DSM 2380 / NBRC 103641 / GraBd1) TaxID=338963 RepID=Q3A501_SYNC1|nr:CDP-diacylglycerol--glycerol-3-phosphate 3-phosphatidyltransferase [Syntrophotalea carbinolica]ABA88556.1 CDP-diacylglycerol--glycerol-3-phosphate 3-phosphatidyltransferase [Syntrophotalea carbinolica DSM 2380]
MTIPNMLTLARIALVPVFLISIIYGQLHLSLGIFIFEALTDALDGYLARRLHQETQLGLYLDPLADKLLSTVSFVSLAIIGLLPAWLAVVVFFKDLFIGLGVAVIFFTGGDPKAMPTLWGKRTMFVQAVCVGAALLWALMGYEFIWLDGLFWLTAGMTILSGGHYIYQGLDRMGQGRNENSGARI